jgi:exopolysaccharide biosynthesis polyprenyl glycosylphosphotransferase
MARLVASPERVFLLMIADAAGALTAVVLAFWTWTLTAGFRFDLELMQSRLEWFWVVPIWVVALAPTRYIASAFNVRETLFGIVRAGVVLFAVYLVVFFDAGRDVLPRLMVLYVLWYCAGLAIASRLLSVWAFTRGQSARRLVIMGDAPTIEATLPLFELPALRDVQLIGLLTVEDVPASIDVPRLGRPENVEFIVQQYAVSEILVSFEKDGGLAFVDQLLRCQDAGREVIGMPQLYETVLRRVPVRHIAPVWLLTHLSGGAATPMTSRMAKRLLDLMVAVPLAAVGLILSVGIALAIVIDSGFPILYAQMRGGLAGRPFRLFKFRTMRKDAEASGPQWSPSGDPRITRVGKILRRTHLDELPNLWSVIRGDMSMVGPRPERPEFVALLEQEVPHYRARLATPPGLTGWAQVNYNYGDSIEDATAKLEFDLYYIRHQSVGLDLEIVARTFGRMFGWRGR